MAINKNRTDSKIVVRVENGTSASGAKNIKNLNYSSIRLDATDEQLLAAGKAISELQSKVLSAIRVVETYDMSEG
jgi:hypothetical protein